MDKALAFIDLLGFSSMVTKNYSRAQEVLSDFYNISFGIIQSEPLIQGTLFSDCLVAHSENKSLLLRGISSIYRDCLKKNLEYTETELSDFFLLPRGGISVGVVNIEQRMEAPNLRKEFIVSPALVHSAKMEKSIKGSRLLVAVNQDNGEELDIIWNAERNLLYKDEAIKFWNRYTYNDALWFTDLDKDFEAQQEEIRELIDIAIQLVKANDRNKSFLMQHLGTLRIGLLSYSPFFNATECDDFISYLLNEFSDEKYWYVWISIFEMVIQSPNNWAVPEHNDLVTFYKRVCMSRGWKNVLEYANSSDNYHTKRLLDQFIEELIIKTM